MNKDANFGLAYLDDFTHVAVVADVKWMQTLTQAIGSILAAEVKVFKRSQIAAAREWLLSVPDTKQHSAIEYRNNPENNIVENIVEICVDGKISKTELDRRTADIRAK